MVVYSATTTDADNTAAAASGGSLDGPIMPNPSPAEEADAAAAGGGGGGKSAGALCRSASSRSTRKLAFYLGRAKAAALHGVNADMDSIVDEDPIVAAIHARAEARERSRCSQRK